MPVPSTDGDNVLLKTAEGPSVETVNHGIVNAKWTHGDRIKLSSSGRKNRSSEYLT